MKEKTLAIEEISLKDERFRISYYFSLEKLIHSLKEIGLIHPPLVNFRDQRFILVSGWKRVLACLELSLSPIEVLLTEEEDELQLFLRAFYENLVTREFSLVEKSEILHKLLRFGEKKQKIISQYLPLLNIPSATAYLDLFLAISQFEPELKKSIHEKNMPLASVQLLAEFIPEERRLILPLLLPLGQNKQKEILEDLQEISRKNDIPVKEILVTAEIQEILDSPKLSSLQKSERLRIALRKKKYPCYSSWKDSFDAFLRKVRWPKEIPIKPSPFFEDDTISVTLHFKNEEEFRANLSKLQEIASQEEFSKMFK